jgi:hypothetical protein
MLGGLEVLRLGSPGLSISGSSVDPSGDPTRTAYAAAARSTVYKQGFELIPAAGKTMSYPLQIREAGSGFRVWWGAFMRGAGATDPLPKTHFYIKASVITPISASFADPGSPVASQLLFATSSAAKRLNPGDVVGCDTVSGARSVGDEIMVRTYAVGEGTVATLGANIATTGATSMTLTTAIDVSHPLYNKEFFAQIDSEYVLVAAGTTTTRTITRAQGGTTAATHSSGANVGHVVEVPSDKSTAFEVNAWSWDGDQTMTPGATKDSLPQHFIYTPMTVTTVATDRTTHVVAIIGDSNSHGQGEALTPDNIAFGFAERACELAGLPFVNLAAGGTGLATWVDSPDVYWSLPPLFGCTIGLICLGTNRGLESGATLLSELQSNIALARAAGLRPVVCTIPPYRDEGDAAYSDASRDAYNTGIRAMSLADGAVGDLASAVEVDGSGVPTLNGGTWGNDVLTGSPYGSDLHSSSLGHAAEAIPVSNALTAVATGHYRGLYQSTFIQLRAPDFLASPVVSGSTPAGSVLTRTTGIADGNPAPTYSTQWRKDGVAIGGQTGSTYTTANPGDIGGAIDVLVTATNTQGSDTADSNDITVIAPSAFDPDVTFDLGYGIGTDLGANASTITTWGHTLSLAVDGTGLALPVVATDTGKKVARFTAATPTHIGNSLPSPASMPFDVWMVTKHVAPIAGHISGFFAPHPGSTVSASIEAHAAFPSRPLRL